MDEKFQNEVHKTKCPKGQAYDIVTEVVQTGKVAKWRVHTPPREEAAIRLYPIIAISNGSIIREFKFSR